MPIKLIIADFPFTFRGVSFPTRSIVRTDIGSWSFIEPSYSIAPDCASLWHKTMPLRLFQCASTTDIVARIESLMERRLIATSFHPVAVLSDLAMSNHVLNLDEAHLQYPTPAQMNAVRIALDYVVQITQCQRSITPAFSFPDSVDIRWVDEPNADEPFSMLLPDTLDQKFEKRLSALPLVLRSFETYDGSTDFMFERYMKCVIGLLVDSSRVSFLPYTDCVQYASSNTEKQEPLLIAGGCSEWTDEVKEEMAAAAHPTLIRMIREHLRTSSATDVLPARSYVYGIHWSTQHVRILAHFPSYNQISGEWEFRQAVLAEHWAGIRTISAKEWEYGVCAQADLLFMARWRLSIALLTVAAHVDDLERWLVPEATSSPQPLTTDCSISLCLPPFAPSLPLNLPQPAIMPTLPHANCRSWFRTHLQRLRLTWLGETYKLPSDWIPTSSINTSVSFHPVNYQSSDLISTKTLNLVHCYLLSVAENLRPLSDEMIVYNHQHEVFVPDYVHPSHTPRGATFSVCPTHGRREVDTNPHLFKLHDLLAMAVGDWHDVNIYIANAFSSFSTYGVRWDPPSNDTQTFLDFALVVQRIPPTTDITIPRSQRKPPSKSCPAVLLGCRAHDTDNYPSVVTLHEKSVLSNLMKPYVDTLKEYLTHLSRHSGGRFRRPTWAVLFCTYLKTGFLHILAFRPLQRTTGCFLVDSIPITTRNNTAPECRGRLRLALALFTLQRHVVRFAEHWDDSLWPQADLESEYARLVELLGPSESRSSSAMSVDDPHLYEDPPQSELSFERVYETKRSKGGNESDENKSRDDDDSSGEDYSDEDTSEEYTNGDFYPNANLHRPDEGCSDRARQQPCDPKDQDAGNHTKGPEAPAEHRWSWLKRAYAHYKLSTQLEHMESVEAWVEAYDPANLQDRDRPVP